MATSSKLIDSPFCKFSNTPYIARCPVEFSIRAVKLNGSQETALPNHAQIISLTSVASCNRIKLSGSLLS